MRALFLYTPGAVLSSFNHCRNAPSITRLRSSFRSLATVSTAEITSLSKRILTAERPGCIGGRPAPGRGPPGLLFFLVATLVLPCFGGGILENGTETRKQEQYRPQVNDVRWKRRSLRTHTWPAGPAKAMKMCTPRAQSRVHVLTSIRSS